MIAHISTCCWFPCAGWFTGMSISHSQCSHHIRNLTVDRWQNIPMFKGSLIYRLMNTRPTRTFGFQFRSSETVCFPLPLFVHSSIFMLNWSTWTCVQHLRSSNIIAFPHLQQPGQRWIPVPCGMLWSPIWTTVFSLPRNKANKKIRHPKNAARPRNVLALPTCQGTNHLFRSCLQTSRW